jgi:hypothetical protein
MEEEKIIKKAMDVLIKELGPVEAMKFLQKSKNKFYLTLN